MTDILYIQGVPSSQTLLYAETEGMYSGTESPVSEGVDSLQMYSEKRSEGWVYPCRVAVSDKLYKMMKPILSFAQRKGSESKTMQTLAKAQEAIGAVKNTPEMVMIANNDVCMLILKSELPDNMQSLNEA